MLSPVEESNQAEAVASTVTIICLAESDWAFPARGEIPYSGVILVLRKTGARGSKDRRRELSDAASNWARSRVSAKNAPWKWGSILWRVAVSKTLSLLY